MNILYSTSSSYFKCFLVSAYSLCVSSCGRGEPVNIYLFSNGLSREELNKVDQILGPFPEVKLCVIDVLGKLQSLACKMGLPSIRGSYATYFRLVASDLLPECSKVICIDSDTLVLSSLIPLWNFDLGGKAIGACPEASIYLQNSSFEDDFVLRRCVPYFNIGVCVIDFDNWRSQKLSKVISDYFAQTGHFSFRNDQSIVNFLLHSWMINIPLRYNYSTPVHGMTYKKYIYYFGGPYVFPRQEFENASKDPAIIHFFGQPLDRPWYYHSASVYLRTYRDFWKKVSNGKLEKWPRNSSGFVFAIHDAIVYLLKKIGPQSLYRWFRYRISQSIRKRTKHVRNSK